jgi:exoribonuclease R
MHYKIHILDSNYRSWEIYDQHTNTLVELDINPIEKKILSGDVIDNTGTIISSPLRLAKNLAGILILKGKTYGRNTTGKKFLYKCIPNDKRLPAFLIPYEEKQVTFNKNIINKYVLFKFNNWDSKHPVGTLNNVVGNINDLSAFYEYQLHCKDLFKPLKQFINDVNRANRELGINIYDNIIKMHQNIEDRRDHYVISIDPNGSTDLDDAFSMKDNILSIYVANVPLLLDYFKLWNSFSERISTIYLPDRKCPMLPTLLSENLCSLLEKQERLAFCIDLTIDDNQITDIIFKNVIIKVSKNYIYNEDRLHDDELYKKVFECINKLNKKEKYMREITDSHHIVSYLMLLMNNKSADKLEQYQTGIYRSITLNESKLKHPDTIPSEIYDFIKIWQCASGKYTNYKENNGHQLINSGLDNYVHITSPIRRLVDLLNMLKIQEKLKLINLSSNALDFYNYWENQLEYINTTMRAIRKVQTDCNMLNMCTNDTTILDSIYIGYLFDMIERPYKLNQYTVYIPDLKLFTRVNTKNIVDNYTSANFKLYLLQDGITLKRKIRAEII